MLAFYPYFRFAREIFFVFLLVLFNKRHGFEFCTDQDVLIADITPSAPYTLNQTSAPVNQNSHITVGADTASDGHWDRIVTYVRDGPPPKSQRSVYILLL